MRFDIETNRIFSGTTRAIGKGRYDAYLPGFNEWCRRRWPDLPAHVEIVIIPEEDFNIIVAATAGRPSLALRDYSTVRLAGFPARVWRKHLDPYWPAIFYAVGMLVGVWIGVSG